MNKSKFFVLIFLLLLFYKSSYSNWDIRIYSNVGAVKISFRIVTVPFEGLNRYQINSEGNNRIKEIQNGCIHRRYYTNPTTFTDNSILYSTSDTGMTLASCFSEVILGYPVYGFGKYLVTIENIIHPEKSINFYWNTLDSKSGQDTVLGKQYHADWVFGYFVTSDSTYVTIGSSDVPEFVEYINTNQQFKEITVWKAFFGRSEPVEKKFYARSTPFPINPNYLGLAQETNYLRNLVLGTTVILDTVYKNLGNSDRYGYNTVMTNPWNYYENPPILPSINNEPGEIFCTPAYGYFDGNNNPVWGIKLTLENSNKIILKRNKKLWVCGLDYSVGGDTVLFRSGSELEKEINSKICTYNGGVVIDSGCNSIWNPNSELHSYENSTIVFAGMNHEVNNGGIVVVDTLGNMKIGDNTTVTFDGTGTYLKLNSNAIVHLGANAKIKFTNGAYLDANGATFSAINSNNPYVGLEFENAGSTLDTTKIFNCTFNGAISPIRFINDEQHANLEKIITNDTFNLPSSGTNSAIYADNLLNVNIYNNHFNMASGSQSIGIYIKNYYSNNTPHILITDNTFQDGNCSIILADYTAAQLNYFVYHNHFNLNSGGFNIITRMMTGDIKNNFNTDNNPNYNIIMNQSNPNIYGNSLNANFTNLFVAANSYPLLSSVQYSEEQLISVGGSNNFTINDVENSRNLFFNDGYAYLDYGNNSFAKINNSSHHLEGAVVVDSFIYYVRNNCFNNQNEPSANLYKCGTYERVFPYWQGSTNVCTYVNNNEDFMVVDKGFGIYDTIYLSSNNNPQPANDEELYSQAFNYKMSENFANAISAYKSLINGYFSSNYLNTSLYDLYECYEGLDTSSSQSFRNLLYGNLKDYLDNKIRSGNYDDNFIDIAYNFTAMCMVNMQENSSAAEAYEFISLFNPDPTVQLYASWDYTILEEIMGSGGSESEKYKNESDMKFMERRIKYFEKMIGIDPIKNKVKKAYDSKKLKRDNNFEKELQKNENNQYLIKSKINERNNKENIIRNKASSNIRNLRYLTKAEKDKRQLEDIILASQGDLNISNSNRHSNNLVPDKFELFQNYPNPFNPVTKIKYELPINGMVKLMVYDILGREIKTLVNEFRQEGKYSVEFDGSNFASGVYFYKIQTGDFISVKRMVMIK